MFVGMVSLKSLMNAVKNHQVLPVEIKDSVPSFFHGQVKLRLHDGYQGLLGCGQLHR